MGLFDKFNRMNINKNSIPNKNFSKFINMLCDYFKGNQMKSARIFVALKNWDGIRFWYKCGFAHITCTPYEVSYSEETFASIELGKVL